MDNRSQKSNNTIQTFWVGIGSFASFSFTIISAGILSRFLSREDYGTYRQILYVYSILLAIFSVGLPKAFSYFLPRIDIVEANSLIKKLTIIFLLLGAIFSSLLYFSSPVIARFLKNPDLEIGLKYFSPIPTLMLPTMGIEGVYATLKKTYVIALYTLITRAGMLVFVALPVILYQNNYLVAVQGFCLSSLLSFFLALYLKHRPYKKINSIKTAITYKEIFRFCIPLMSASIWGIAINAADEFYISRYFGQSVFAEFANGSLQLPFVAMVSGATSTVLLPVFSKMVKNGANSDEVLAVWKSAMEKSIMIIYPLVLFFWFFAKEVMVLLYGGTYSESANYFRIMLLVNFFNIILFAPAILALGATKFYSRVHLFFALLIWALEFVAGVILNNSYLISAASVICKSLLILVLCSFIAKKFRLSIVQLFPLKLISKIFISCGITLCLIKLLFNLLSVTNPLIILLISSILFLCSLLVTQKVTNINYINIIKPLFSNFKIKNRLIYKK